MQSKQEPQTPVQMGGAAEALSTETLLQSVLPASKKPDLLSRLGRAGIAVFRVLTANPKMIIGTTILVFFFLVGIFGPMFLGSHPNAFTNDIFQQPSAKHLLGTSSKGEDTFSQLVEGARYSLLIGFVSAIGATLLSVIFGLCAGYFGGFVDDVLSLIINVFLVLPSLPLAVVIASFATFKGPSTIILVLLFTSWSWGARVLRAQTLSMRHRDFVEAARAVGETPLRIVFMEILPNEIAIVASSFVTTFIYTILTEVALEYLGLGDVLGHSWGIMLYWAQSDQALLAGGWWLFVPPGLCIAILGAGLAFLNYGIDEVANPRLRKERVQRKAKGVAA